MRRFWAGFGIGFLFCTLTLLPPAAAEGPGPQEILERMEKTINGFDDQEMDLRLTIVDVDGSKKSYEFTIWQKGDQKRLIKFTSGEIKGMATLVQDRNNVYVYLPGFKKVRRVAAHNMNQSFAGSDFSNDDMATVSWTKIYTASPGKEEADAWWITATPKPGEQVEYSKVDLKLDKKTGTQQRAVYFNKAGEKVKTFDNTNLTDWNGVPRAKNVVVADPRTGHRTEMEVKSFKVNQGLKDDMFTVRELQWGK
ncbi:MAG: outer membrane lipoprotein-sorting protein [Deltaproteobacteria bacterium]|nr:outer membrane lipoprotein-sorting protein [Deltaproteobacteria bacterium]